MTSSTRLRFGILGAAKIARTFAAAVSSSPLIELRAVASRDLEKGDAFAREFGIASVHGSYEALLADPQIDAVYIPLPNTLHAEWAIRALEAGKHVLCEKPIAITAADARAMYDTARKCGVTLAEAYPYRAQEQTLKLRELLRDGAIGGVQTVHASFGVTFDDPSNIRLDPQRGGGALLDAGSYAMSFVRMIAGENPTRVNAVARMGATGVDRTVVANLDFASGLLAQISCSFASAYHRHALIAGSGGIIETTYLNNPPDGGEPVVHLRRGVPISTPRETIVCEGGSGFLKESESFVRLVREGTAQWTGASEAESIGTIAALEAIERSVRSGNWEPVEH